MTEPPDEYGYYVSPEPEEPPDDNVWATFPSAPKPGDNPYLRPPAFGTPPGGWPRARGEGIAPLGAVAGFVTFGLLGWLVVEGVINADYMLFLGFGSVIVAAVLLVIPHRFWRGFGTGMLMGWGLAPVLFFIACVQAFSGSSIG